MWISRDVASRLSDAANVVLIVSLVIGVLATSLLVWMGNIKEAYSARDISAANAGAEAAKSHAATANAKAALANEHAARLEKEAEEARLEAEQLKQELAWRTITHVQMDEFIRVLKGKHLSVVLDHVTDPEAVMYAMAFESTLRQAGVALRSVGPETDVRFGVSLQGEDSAGLNDLSEALSRAGIPFARGAKSGPLTILVGSKQPL